MVSEEVTQPAENEDPQAAQQPAEAFQTDEPQQAAEPSSEEPRSEHVEVAEASSETPGVDEITGSSSEVSQTEATDEAKATKPKRKGKRSFGKAGHRVKWDDIFLKQRLSIMRSLPADPVAIRWAVDEAGPLQVAEILGGEGSSGREFGRRAFQAKPETDNQAAWIVLAAVRARDVVAVAREAVSGSDDQEAQIRSAVELLGAAKVLSALKSDQPAQQIFAARAARSGTDEASLDASNAWALLALARPQEVQNVVTPRRKPTGKPSGDSRDGDGFGGRRGRKREPELPGGIYTTGESSIGGQLGMALREAFEKAEKKD